MRLLEREPSLAALAEYAAEARNGAGRLVLVSGEAGVGKSALVARFQQDLQDGGTRQGHQQDLQDGGTTQDGQQDLPDSRHIQEPPDGRARDDLRDARWSWGMCDGLFTPRPLGPLFDVADQRGGALLELCRTGAGRDELFRGLLRELTEPGTLNVIVVEDIHWADEATLDLLRFLGRRIWNAPVLLIATYRDEGRGADDPLRVTLGDLAAQRSTRRIELAPLSAESVAVLARGSGWEAAALHRLTCGNPFYVTEVVQAGLTQVPPSARDAVLARATRLGGDVRRVLDVAALTGTRVEPRLLESVTGCPPSALDELLGCGLVVEDGQWLRFRHEIARLAVAGAIPAHRVRAVHGRVLAALADMGCDDDARMAFHAEAAADAAAVLRHAPAAARRAAWLTSHREAAAQFARALRFAGEADAATLAALYEGLADEWALLDRWPDAAQAGEQALAQWRKTGNRLREGDALRRLSRVLWNLCRADQAVAAAEAALSVLEPLGPSVELAWAYATFANRRMLLGEHEAAVSLGVRAKAIAERLGATDVLSDVLNTLAVCAAATGGAWAGQLRRALEIALAGRHQDQAGRAFANLCGTHVSEREFAEAERYVTQGLPYCDEHDLTAYATHLRSEHATIMERRGQWAESAALSTELLATDAMSSSCNRLCILRKLGVLRARRGEPGVWEFLEESAEIADRTGEPQQIVPVRLACAEAHWLEGSPDRARDQAELAADASGGCDHWDRGAAAVWLLRTGSARSVRGEVAEPYRLHLDGHLTKAAQVWIDLGCPYDAALTLADVPREPALRQALDLLTGLGAAPAIRLVRQRLRELGVRSLPSGPRATTREHPYGLTERERQVLALLCERHSNLEIAAALFISVRTVGHHVSSILAKLGAPTRNAAADQAIELGLI
ncbi:helix-turn-helix transcriptional regulator [Nonomuraea zeae]|uniref:Helix-turn-helix transcriptional regulator n=1 Tax=Nonomuraea zeae TaxID=1642303 RepID=A0A5S4GMI5_9ACTN|nr:AAA family ATPase [Nonomuraea zeae]TMR34156.1 helix-turn-helix transcriptional regulator [Nonomuraea zeae]